MKFYNQKVVCRVRAERQKGLSIKILGKKFKISHSTISRWVRDMPSKFKAFNSARKHEKNLKLNYSNLIDKFLIDKDTAKILASLLYWCEGSKYPSSNFLAFSNSDHLLVKTFIGLLRKGFKLDESKLRAHLQLHTTHDIRAMTKFWGALLGIKENQFHKPTITVPTNRMKRRDYKGTCTIKYFDVKLLLNITGIFESFGKKKWRGGRVA
ncbi:MAG TPA: hypothetical protein DEB73_02155 [Candidatus Magasanikbacteria bacterium]|uniref:Uncharacterized protein n=2 Tax=Candidatus Magasanikiibacteriota TaxID=1752731 RepID=A0A0G0WKM5_9BACT|nr:MAG: hypothetical protein UU49_C0008G0011 [Candidatus Magasanikbacteria bacterium GW2011_GWC2_41_17]KKS13395.1 MAG: hypothetical protein UU69_C0006G0003 [Candidatus Magasanikbacteria bacterium GW2011_GWA2_41_55]HBV58043.1 hypothetical protein [Candidatus Magasanikbacteria bacterium]HBX15699.1 hypothetical protein [Candidatus Magasanikbacteria bacterium]